jgi:hypothetical protein
MQYYKNEDTAIVQSKNVQFRHLYEDVSKKCFEPSLIYSNLEVWVLTKS